MKQLTTKVHAGAVMSVNMVHTVFSQLNAEGVQYLKLGLVNPAFIWGPALFY